MTGELLGNVLTGLHAQLPVLQIIVPMLAAPVCIVLKRPLFSWLTAMAATATSLISALLLLRQVLAEGTLSYHLGGWAPPQGIELRIGVGNAFVLVTVTAVSAVVMVAAPRGLMGEVAKHRHYLIYSAYLLCMTGLLGMTAAGDAFNIFVFLEISSLSAYALIASGPSKRALSSAFQYLVMGTLGGTFVLLGVGMLYMVTGTLNIAELGERLAGLGEHRTVLVALACIVVGTSIKVALFPLHIWLPNAYTYAPAIVTAFLSATATKVAFFVMASFVFKIFGAGLAFGEHRLDAMLQPAALLAMLVASTVAIFQQDVKRLLAYSSLGQIGYMVLGLSFASIAGLTGAVVHLFNHALIKGGLFLLLAGIVVRLRSTQLEDLRGLGRRMPWTMGAFVAGGLSLIGVPLTAGFVSKWYLVKAALLEGRWPLAVLVLGSSLLAVLYIWRVVETAYFQAPPEGAPAVAEAPKSMLIPAYLLVGASLVFGVVTSPTVGVAARAAELLLGDTW